MNEDDFITKTIKQSIALQRKSRTYELKEFKKNMSELDDLISKTLERERRKRSGKVDVGGDRPREEAVDASRDVATTQGGITDTISRHLSNEYHRSRVPLEDPHALVLPDKRLLRLEGVEAAKYREALENILGHEVEDRSFMIDRTGSALGYDLDDWLIIVSKKQFSCDTMSDDFSFMDDLLDIVQEKAGNIINQVTLSEALYGRVRTDMEKLDVAHVILAAAIGDKRDVTLEVDLDTPSGALETVLDLRRVVTKAKGDPTYILSAEVQNAIVDAYNLKYGSGEGRTIGNLSLVRPMGVFPIQMQLGSFKLRGDEMDLYGLHTDKPVMIYFEHHGDTDATRVTDDYIILNGHDTSAVLETLLDEGVFGFAPEAGEAIMRRRLAEERDISQDLSVLESNGELDVKSVLELVDKAEGKTPEPEDVRYMRRTIERIREAPTYEAKKEVFMGIEDHHVKMQLVYPLVSDPMVSELLTRLQITDVSSKRYHNTQQAINYINEHSPEEVGKWLADVASKWTYQDEQNPWVNMYVAEKMPEAIERAGLHLVK